MFARAPGLGAFALAATTENSHPNAAQDVAVEFGTRIRMGAREGGHSRHVALVVTRDPVSGPSPKGINSGNDCAVDRELVLG